MRVQIVFFENPGRGLKADIQLLTQLIESQGHEVTTAPQKRPSLRHVEFSNKWYYFLNRRIPETLRAPILRYQRKLCRCGWRTNDQDLVIHLENIKPNAIDAKATNWLIPNQEWFQPKHLHYLEDFDSVLCKTREAERLFSHYHPFAIYTSFSSPLVPQIDVPEKQPARNFLHIAGRSRFKGTSPVIEAWKRHPEWPTLKLVCDSHLLSLPLPRNIEHQANVSGDELCKLWTEAEIVVIPSEVEGFGQVLLEAMAYGRVLITTDAAPMNELVTRERGFLIPHQTTASLGLGTRYITSPEQIETVIEKAMTTHPDKLKALSCNARQWAISNHLMFETEFFKQLNAISKHNAS